MKSEPRASATGSTGNWSFFRKREKRIETGKRNRHDTIAAISTASGSGGIGIVRISGELAINIAERIFLSNRKGTVFPLPVEHGRIRHGHVFNPGDGGIIDEAILVPMLSPNSYTREDVVEIQAHGGRAVLQRILDIVLKEGARLAEPGEFTKRAFLNGRIDLSRAEAVIDLIEAESEGARKIAASQLHGGLHDFLARLKRRMFQALAEVELEIDFSEDEEDRYANPRNWEEKILRPLERLSESAAVGDILKDGFRIVLAGKPNVGKSSLMNRWLNHERAIVTPYPGTTRDHIEETVSLDGVLIRLFDTAGLRESDDPVEKIGVERTKTLVESAHLVLLVCDVSSGPDDEDRAIFQSIRQKDRIVIYNKNDLLDFQDKPFQTGFLTEERSVAVSAKFGNGISELKELIRKEFLLRENEGSDDVYLSNLRHRKLVENARLAIERAILNFDETGDLEIASIEFKEAIRQIDEILGVDVGDDVLDAVFQRFCIGK